MIRRPPRSTQSRSSAASDVYKRQEYLSCVCLSDYTGQNNYLYGFLLRDTSRRKKDPMNLLIVDDTPINLKLLRAQMDSEGHAVFEAHDGLDALALLERQRVDAVISDILMPRMDGYRLCYEIRKHERLHDLPIIIYTSTYTSSSDEKLALEMGADKYLK